MRINHLNPWGFRTDAFLALIAAAFCCTPAWAGSHTWRVNEVFSNFDGTVQFVELKESCGSPGETSLATHQVKSNSNTVNLANLPANSSANKHLLFGTANLTSVGGPTPDYIVPAQFFSLLGDLLQYTPYHSCTIASGTVPTGGTNSLNRAAGCAAANCPTGVALNTPTNFAGQTGTVSAISCIDLDIDGYGSPGHISCPNGAQTDCNNSVAAINPGATENCGDVIDNNCNGDVDCADSACLAAAACVPALSNLGLMIMASLSLATGSIITARRVKQSS